MTDLELRASHEDRDRVAELSRDLPVGGAGVPPESAGPVALRIVLSGTVQTGHLRARQPRRASRRRA